MSGRPIAALRPRPRTRPWPRVSALLRRRVAPSAGLALLLAGGALAVRVAVMRVAGSGGQHGWLFTAAACVLAGVALVLIALPKLAPSRDETGAEPSPELPPG